jgi:hypothetical protein
MESLARDELEGEAVGEFGSRSAPARRLISMLSQHRREITRWFVVAIGVGAAAAALFVGLDAAARHAFAGNSDGATVVLEGVAIRHGHLLLNGWDLSYDSFWGIDAVAYAVVSLVLGLRRDLLDVVPTLLALGVIAVSVSICWRGRRPQVAGIAALVVVAVLGLPSPVLAFFLLQGPWHVGTALWCLIAFVGLRRRRFDLGWVVAVLFLATALLSDLSAIPLGLLPSFFVGLLAMARYRSIRSGLSTLAAAVLAALLALGVRALSVHIGTFSIAHGVTKAQRSEYPENVKLVLRWGAGLLGAGKVPIGPTPALGPYELLSSAGLQRAFHLLVLVVVVAAFVFAVVSLVFGAVTGRQLLALSPARSHLNDLLLSGAGGSAALFVVLCPNGNGDYARYLTPAVIFAAVLAASVVAHVMTLVRTERALNLVLAVVVALSVVGVVGFDRELDRPSAPQSAVALGSFLEAHDLRSGVGDYWSSSIVTVVTGGQVAVRPVIPNKSSILVRYGRQSAADWYANVHFTFLVFDLARPWRGVNATTATATLGKPAQQFNVGTYVVLVWPQGFQVSAAGYTRV